MHRKQARPLQALAYGAVLSAVCLVCRFSAADAAASTSPTATTCTGLSVSLSSNRDYYIFTAGAAGDVSAITGYTFSFGDHASYAVAFGPSTTQDRLTASVTHTYENTGIYTATVHVDTDPGNKKTSVSSAACQATVPIDPPASSLPSAGAQNAIGLFVGSALTGTLAYSLWLRHRALSNKRFARDHTPPSP